MATSLRGPLQFPKIKTANPAFAQPQDSQVPLVRPAAVPGVQGFDPNLAAQPPQIPNQVQAKRTEQTQIKPLTPAVPSVQAPAPSKAVETVTPIAPTQVKAAPKPVETVQPISTPSEAPKAAPPVQETETAIAQTDLQLLNDAARDALVSQDDPVSKAKFNQALSNIGLFNQAQRDLLQQQINNNPDLAGQPTGTALLSMMARQQGADVSNLITTLSLESANRIRDLNKWGFERLSAITTFKKNEAAGIRSELLQAGDFTGYANRFKEDISEGKVEEARKHFDIMVALAPNLFKGATFEEMGFADKSYLLKSERDEGFDAQIRLDVNQNQIDDAINGIETRFNLEERQAGGLELFESKTLEEINAALTAAGLDTIEDKTELIGQEQELFTAFKIADIMTQSDRTPVDDINDFFLGEIQKLNGNVLLDDIDKRLIRGFANDVALGGEYQTDADGNIMVNPNELVKPWEAGSATEHNFKNWPVMLADGSIEDSPEFFTESNPEPDPDSPEFFTESNPEPDPDSATGIYYADLNKKFDAYNLNTPQDERVSMINWFRATQAGTQEFDKELIPEGERKEPGIGGEIDLEKLKADIGAMNPTDFDLKIVSDEAFRKSVLSIANDFTSNNSVSKLTLDNVKDDIIGGTTKGLVKIGGESYKFQNPVKTAHNDQVEIVSINEDGTEGETFTLFLSSPNGNADRDGKIRSSVPGGPEFVSIEEFIQGVR